VVDVRATLEEQIAQFIRNHEIDVLWIWWDSPKDSRFSVLSRRAAPIQVNFLGYPGTMGADSMDYIIADPTVIPKEHFPVYSEGVVWLPDAYLPNAYRPKENNSHNEPHNRQGRADADQMQLSSSGLCVLLFPWELQDQPSNI
jgi:predicted O-linked N-acetylglucosamine transferase (SPINDLY family)